MNVKLGMLPVFCVTIAAFSLACEEEIELAIANRTNSDVCFYVRYDFDRGEVPCDAQNALVEANSAAVKGFLCTDSGDGGKTEIPVSVWVEIRRTGKRIYDTTVDCWEWQESNRRFIIEERGGELVVTDPLP